MKSSFKTTGNCSTVVALNKNSAYVLGPQCNCKAGAGGCCKHVAALLYSILDYVELGLAIIPEERPALATHNNGIGQEIAQVPRNILGDGPILFSEIQFVRHS